MNINHLLQVLRLVIIWSPLVAMPLILILRWDALIASNEEPKWFVLLILGIVVAIAGAFRLYLCCRTNDIDRNDAGQPGLSLPGSLFVLFFVGLSLGLTHTVNLGEGFNRLAFWCSGGLTFWASSWAARHDRRYPERLQLALCLSAALLCAHFWYGFFVDFHNPSLNKFVHFSLIGHFNFTADVLMVLMPLLWWTFLSNQNRGIQAAAGFTLATSAFMLITSGSQGGMGGLLVGGLIAGGLGLARQLSSKSKITILPGKRALIATSTTLLILALAGKWIYQEMPTEYRDQIFVHGEWWDAPKDQDFAKAKSLPPLAPLWIAITPYLGSRTPMWAATSGMVAERPWTGFGTGSYLFEYPGFSKRYDLFGDFETLGVKVKTNPHNILLQIASENGIPMMLLFAGLYIWLTVRVTQQAWREPTALWLCGVWALWAAGLDAQVNHVFFNPASLFMSALGFGFWQGRLPSEKPDMTIRLCPFWNRPVSLAFSCIVVFVIASYPLRWVASEYYVGEAMRLSSATPPASPRKILATWVKARVKSPTNIQSLYGLATVALKIGDRSGAEDYLKACLKFAPNHSPALNLLATIQSKSGRINEAETTLIKALSLEPDSLVIKENLEEVRKAKKQAKGAETN